LAGVGAFTMFASEKTARAEDIGGAYNVTAVNATDCSVIVDYQSTRCMTTCIGWSVDDLEPPPEEIPSRVDMLFLFAVIAGVRLLFLYLEFTALDMMQARFEGHAKVAPLVEEEVKKEEVSMRESGAASVGEVADAAASMLE